MRQQDERIALKRTTSFMFKNPDDASGQYNNLCVLPGHARMRDLMENAYLDCYQPSGTLPREFYVYRGDGNPSHRAAVLGAWWTTSLAVAGEYASRRTVMLGERAPYVLIAPAYRADGRVVIRADRYYLKSILKIWGRT